jgi:phage gpG-like protein
MMRLTKLPAFAGVPLAINSGLQKGGLHVANEVAGLIKTGSRTGRVYRYNGRNHQSSRDGEAPANRNGRLANSYTAKPSNMRVEVGSPLDYAAYLEQGTRNMGSRPHLAVTAIKNSSAVAQFINQEVIKQLC